MKHRLTKAAAALAIATAAVFAAPAMANAYTPSGPDSSTTTITPGGTANLTFTGFEPGESVTFTLTGENGAGATLAFVKFAVSSASLTKSATAAGAAPVSVTLPTNASGTYTLAASAASGNATQQIVVGSAAGGAATLPSTGFDGDGLLGVWIGGGALVLAGSAVAVAATVRRNRQNVAA
ncbi:hypothetical protein [Microbacterium memoriense]|uniref:LPXTG cell wall anchor domain-containing protein n=1 Tax=Microbacterium memoriense TaxID=2978350 RepID=A0ABT2PBI7_9MICO|nr:hypothetical protein [Microbacterium memoriense]MCT9001956.1 hypothetical protein [Microbacterium memoriense]